MRRGSDHYPRNHPRIEALEFLEQVRKPVGRDGGAGADVERACEFVGELRDTGFELPLRARIRSA